MTKKQMDVQKEINSIMENPNFQVKERNYEYIIRVMGSEYDYQLDGMDIRDFEQENDPQHTFWTDDEYIEQLLDAYDYSFDSEEEDDEY